VNGIDVKQIKSAFERINEAGEQFPPSLPKFLSYCKNGTGWAHKGGAYKRHKKALPKLVDREMGRRFLKELKKSMNVQ